MKIAIDNITYNFIQQGSDHMLDEENLGLAHLIIPGPICKRFVKEVGLKTDGGKPLIPHYDEYDMENLHLGSEHECFNADTQIVLMDYLFAKRRKYKLDYYGLDPYWLFHDSFHAKNDVYNGEMGQVDSSLEYERLLQGAEFAKSKGFEMQPETVAKLDANWKSRWKYRESSNMTSFKYEDFNKFMDEEKQEQTKMFIACGTFTNNY